MEEDPRVRIGIVGAGGIVRQRHAPGLKAIPGVELAAVCNRTRESSERAAREFGMPRVFEDWRELVQSDQVDAVLIGTQPYMHREITLAAVAAGKHVFCQARMAMNYSEARDMFEAAQRSDRTTMLCPPPHYMRGDQVVRRLLREGYVGEPQTVTVRSFSGQYADPSQPLHWRQIWRVSGYNALDVGMQIEVVHRWLGYTRRVSAQAQTFIKQRSLPDGGIGPVERPDVVSAAVQFENGAQGTLYWSGVAHHPGVNAIEICGSGGTLRYEAGTDAPGSGRLLGARSGEAGLHEISVTAAEARTWTVEADFVRAIRERRKSPEPSFWDGLKYMELTEAVFRSAKEGRAIGLPIDPQLRAAQ